MKAGSLEETIELTEVEVVIRSNLSVDDCVVLVRQTEKHEQELVAYVVPSVQFSPERLLSHLQTVLPPASIPTSLVQVSALPLNASGQIDEAALTSLSVNDPDLVQRWEEQLQLLPEVEQVGVVVQEQVKHQLSLHLSDLLPDWKTVTGEGSHTPITPEFTRSAIKQETSFNIPAISHGGELKHETDAPTLLSEALQRATLQGPEKGLVYIQSDGSEQVQSYQDLLLDAEQILAGLRRLGLKPLDKVIFQIDRSQDFIPAFWGCVLGGFIPVPISIAPTYEQVNSTVNKLHNAWQMLEQPIVLTSSGLAESIHSLPALLNIENFQVETIDNLRRNKRERNIHQSQPDDLALLLLTSGSTGLPKGVMLSHRNLLSMAAGTVQMNDFSSQDITLNWMPLDHVGAIVFLGVMAAALGCKQIHVPTEYILQNPIRLLELIQRHKATISWAPNFAFSLLNERSEEINQRSWDLSSMKFLVNAGEQILAKTAQTFLKLLQPHGLPPNAIHPAFGMSETCSGITWSDGFSLETSSDDMSFVELGPPIPGASIRVTDENNQVVAEGVIGRFQVKGLSVTCGYYQNPERNYEAFCEDGWFNTGDLGYLQLGRIVLTGRDKDDIIINGINYYSHEIESVVEEVEGVKVSYTAACSVRVPDRNADQLAIFFSSAVSEQNFLKELIKKIRGAVVKTVGVNPNYIIPVRKEIIPKTAIGKIQRSQLSKRFEAGEFDNIIQQLGIHLDNPNLLQNWFYRKTWRRKAPVILMPSPQTCHFLVFLDHLGLGECLGAELEKQGHSWVGVEVGVDFAQLGSNRYRIAPNNPDHYRRLLSALASDNFQLDKILNLWTYDECISEISSLESLEQSQTQGVYSLLFLIQALAKIQESKNTIHLLVVSSYTQFTSPTDEIAYEKSPIVPLLKTISQEMPGITSRHVDLALDQASVNAAHILQELQVLSGEREVAYRQGQRWIPRLERLDFGQEEKQDLPFKPGGMYLISGGLGGVGVEIAKYLLKHYKARLLLVGRTSLPDRSIWQTHTAQADAVSQKIEAYQELEQLGGEITYQAADVCDLIRLQQVVEQAKSRWQCQLDGVLHLAGIYEERSLIEETQESWSAALRSKVGGAWVLNQLLKVHPESVFISFSSVSSFFGGATVGAFAAANQFLESFSHYQRSKCNLRSYCLIWSLWDGIGISRNYQRRNLAQAKGYCAMTAQQGLYSLLTGLRHDQVQMLVGLDGSNQHIRSYVGDTYPLEKLTAYFTASSNPLHLARLQELVVRDCFGTPSTCNFVQLQQMPLTETGVIDREKLVSGELYGKSEERAQPLTEVERQVALIWQEVLGLEEVGSHDNFFELGGHSLLLVQAQSKLQEYFGTQLSIVDMFKYPTINALTNYLSQEQTEQVSAQRGQERAKLRSSRKAAVDNSGVAVIGMACRFPGANNIDEFWQNLRNDVESISFFADEEILASGVDPTLLRNPNYVKASPILSDVESFDAGFFGYSAREAELMDPQHRLLLECAWESLETAGYNPLTCKGSIGMYAGASMNTYLLNNIYPNRHQLDANDDLQVATLDSMGGFQMMVANDKDYLTTRVSYKLNLTGPSVNVQTACSTSLVAVHMASQSLLNGECDMVLAGGVSIQAPQKIGHLYQEGMIVSPDGHCRAFDSRAQGTIFGSGSGLVVLKRVEDAIADGDCIYAVIKGTALNNDGGMKVGYMAPNGDGQATAASEALAMAGVEAETISYVEAHGTGTPLGDPIEIGGLTQAFRASTQKKNFCAVGSVKTNVGHLQIASGVVGFIKTVLALHHKQLPASLHFEQPNPKIDFANSPFYVNTTLSEWKTAAYPRRAGVNSLGIGGANVHAILEEAPETATVNNGVEHPAHLLTLSAKNEKALQELAHRYEDFLVSHPEILLADVCFTANTGRADFDHRLALASGSTKQLCEQLGAFTAWEQIEGLVSGQVTSQQPPKIAFLFTGQGSQYMSMGRQLYETQPTFRQTLDQCDEILRPYLDNSLLQVLYPDGQSSPIDETAYIQPVLFALEYALAELWKSWGIEPSVVMGHGVGEYVAACVAGVFSLEDGLKLIAERGRLMQALPQDGEMVVLFADETRVAAAIQPYNQKVSIAAVNGPQNTVISGQHQVVRRVVINLEAQGVETRQLKVSHAFHSPLMQPMLAAFERVASEVTFSPPRIGLISNVTGKLTTAEIATPKYWCHHILLPVRFAVGMETLHQQGYAVFVECGPKPTLLGMGRNCIPDYVDAGNCVWLPSLRQKHLDWQQILQSLGELYVRGLPVNWSDFYRNYPRRRLPLPTYPFQRQRYWIGTPEVDRHKARSLSKVRGKHFHPLLGQRVQSALNIKEILFESWPGSDATAFLKHHHVYQTAILPAAAYLEMALAAGAAVFDEPESLVIEDFVILQALTLPEDEVQTVQFILIPSGVQASSFQIYSLATTDEEKKESFWKLHSSGNIAFQKQDAEPDRVDLTALRARCTEEASVEVYYQQYRERDIDYGSSFQAIRQLWRHEGEALGQIQLPEALVLEAGEYKLHPVLLDACFQVSRAAFPEVVKHNTYLPVGIERMHFWGLKSSASRQGFSLWSHFRVRNLGVKHSKDNLSVSARDSSLNDSLVQETLTADLRLFDQTGVVVAEIEGLSMKRASRESLLQVNPEKSWQDWLYEVEWQAQARQGRQLPPDYLCNPQEISDRILPSVASMLPQFNEAVLTQVEALSVAYVLSAFGQMGWKFQQGKRFWAAFIAEELGVVSQHQRLLSRLLEMLAEVGILRQIGKQWEVVVMPEMPEPQEQMSTLLAQYPAAVAQLTMLERCGSKLATVLQGECDPIQLLFPEADLTTAMQVYQDSPDAQVMNTVVQKAISSALENLPQERRLRVLEIGAGTGGTTSYILPHLNPYQTEYAFTDVSPLFTTKAQEKFQDYPFVRYQLLDIEQEPKSQGFGDHQYDLIVATNVLHATSDLRQTLEHVHSLLAPGGILVLLEGTRRQRWLDLIFGLTEGWWKFADLDLRPNYPLLSANRWQELLLDMGFQDAVTIPSAQHNQGVLSQQAVIVAQAAHIQSEVAVPEPKNWLILADAQGIGRQLSAHLQSQGEICTLVFPGKKYEQLAKQEFKIDPASLGDFQRLLEAVGTNKSPLYGVAHLWSLDAVVDVKALSLDLKAAFQQGCGSTLHLVQALVGAGFSNPPFLWLVTQGAVPVKISESQAPSPNEHVPGLAQFPLWGMGKVIAKEHPELKCVRVDLEPGAIGDEAQALFEEIWSEAKEDQVAFRNQNRYVARLVRSRQAQDTVVEDRLHFRGNSTYLITGGLGGLGLLVAHWMVENGARHLVLVGRSGASSAASSQLRELEQAGAKVVVLKADVSEAEQVARVLAEIEQSLPPLRGIIQCVGILDDGVLQQQSWERFARVMAPKVQGSWNLHTLTQNVPLDFFVLFSSVASLLGSAGQANHAAANAFLDVLAHYRRTQGLPGLSINWGAVAEVGAAAKRQAGERLRAQGIGTIAPQQVLEVLEQLFSQTSAQVGVVPINWSQFREESVAWSFLADFQQASEQLSKQCSEFLQQLGAAPTKKRRSLLLAYVCSQVAKVLGLNPSQLIDLQQGFFELGMDSLTSVELRNRLQTSLACKLPSTVAFDYPTVEALVDYLIQEVLTLEFSSKSGVESQEVDEKTKLLAELSQNEIADLLATKLATLG